MKGHCGEERHDVHEFIFCVGWAVPLSAGTSGRSSF